MEGLARTRDILTALRHEGFLCIHGNILVISMDHVNRECEVLEFIQELWQRLGFPGGSVGKNPSARAGNTGSIPGPGRSPMLWSN